MLPTRERQNMLFWMCEMNKTEAQMIIWSISLTGKAHQPKLRVLDKNAANYWFSFTFCFYLQVHANWMKKNNNSLGHNVCVCVCVCVKSLEMKVNL